MTYYARVPQISVGAACPRRRGGGKAVARGGNDHVHGGGDGWMDACNGKGNKAEHSTDQRILYHIGQLDL